MIIRLEYHGSTIHEVRSDDLKDEIVIGRSHSCTWPIPKEDAVASSKHAAVFAKGGKVWVRDLGSTNGIYFQGRNIPQKKLEIGDRVSIGDCILAVDDNPAATGAREPSRLLVLGGPQKGQKRDLLPPKFTIGSDPTSSLVLLDMLVSKRHAEIAVKEDKSCWIRDLGSKNGSSVNGMPLRGDQERMLKDNDKISIAHFDLVFLDGACKHANSQVWLRLGVIAATLVVVVSLYGMFQLMRPSSPTLVHRARVAAANADFPRARELLAAAANARKASRNEIERGDLMRNLGTWELTVETWDKAKRNLERGNWIDASRDLGVLQAGRKDVWTWSEKAVAEKECAMQAKNLLDALTRATASLDRENTDVAEVTQNAAEVKKALAAQPSPTPPYLEKLVADLNAAQKRMRELVQENNRLDTVLAALSKDDPPFNEIITALETVKKNSQGSLRKRAEMSLEPTIALAKSYAALRQASDLVRDLKFSEVSAIDLKLPSVESCAVNARISRLRQQISEVFATLKATSLQLGFLHGEMMKQAGRIDRLPPQIDYWRDPAVMEAVFSCDTLNSPLPKRSRTAPEGNYDQALGTEEFYAVLSALPDPVDPAAVQDLPFPSTLTQARSTLGKVEAVVAFLESADRQWLLGGRLGRVMRDCRQILAARDAMAQDMLKKTAEGGRRGLIAGGIALQLAPPSANLKVGEAELKDWLAAELKKQRATLLNLNAEYGRVGLERQIEIRNEILKLGLPGDPVVRRMWAGRDAAAKASTPKPQP